MSRLPKFILSLAVLVAAQAAVGPAAAATQEEDRARNAIRVLEEIQRIPEQAIPDKLLDELSSVLGDAEPSKTVMAFDGDGTLWSGDVGEDLFHAATRAAFLLEDARPALLAEAARHDIERIVYTSTESILKGRRARRDDGLIDETVSLALDDMPGPYCRSKFLGEQEALAAARRGQPVVIVNPTLPVGPGDHFLTPPTAMVLRFLNAGDAADDAPAGEGGSRSKLPLVARNSVTSFRRKLNAAEGKR